MYQTWILQKHYPSVILLASAVFGLTACKGDELPSTNPKAETTPVTVPQSQEAKPVVTPVRDVPEICPRLIQKKVDKTQTVRHESIKGNHCDYFIYPKIGEYVSVSVSDDRMKPVLAIPYPFDFANGSYQVVQNGRHVIRVEYDAFGTKPNLMNYTIEVDVRPTP